ncbi:progranulin isoform X2 [Terrapene carolina triunguis]|uniref:Granulin n=1 Tax=Terrapene triunguis TaxID=2587831 RepID=A0A674JVN1_9SAUR|nr:progranulin isoform X2 [Terrapene carolina triunguis]
MWLLVPLWLALSGAVASLRCPDGRLCQGLDVCCRDPGGDGYACCPPSLGSLPMTQASSVAKPAGPMCPDGTQCPAEYSCLRTSAGSFSCCPLSEAVACADGHHCCPRGSHCNADGKSCFVLPGIPAAGAVQCPDGESECPNESTCCMMPTGSWGCCPMPQAACCADKVHCCPHATTCDLERARCLSAAGEQPLGSKVPAQKRAPWQGVPVSLGAITCPDHRSACPDGTTCCQLPTSQYGCCPLQNAVCCSDRLHCCPQGTTCDLPHSTCASTLGQTQPLTQLLDTAERAREVPCDEQTSCPDGNTCCRLSTGAWGCCPLVEAVCCQDHLHCCPKGYTCDPAGECQQALLSVPWAPKAPAHIIAAAQSRGVKCSQTVSCEDGQTCCKSGMGSWACCHLPNAVCCEDHQHCCPWGYTCNLATQSCEKHQAGRVLPVDLSLSASLLPASPEPSNDVTCDAQHYCHAHQTCCKAASGAWACCPYHWGSCCSDMRHCCPFGYRCSKSGLDCKRRWLLRWDAGAARPHGLL